MLTIQSDDFCIQATHEGLRDLLVRMIPGELTDSQIAKLAAAIFDADPMDFRVIRDNESSAPWLGGED